MFVATSHEQLSPFSVGEQPEVEVLTPEVLVPKQAYDVALFPGDDKGIALVFIFPKLMGKLRGEVVETAAQALRDEALLDGYINTKQVNDRTALAFVSDPLGAQHVANRIFSFLNEDVSRWQPLALEE